VAGPDDLKPEELKNVNYIILFTFFFRHDRLQVPPPHNPGMRTPAAEAHWHDLFLYIDNMRTIALRSSLKMRDLFLYIDNMRTGTATIIGLP
jgi:hypothetical protein